MRGSIYRIILKIPQTQKHAPTTARSSASLRSSLSYAALVAFANAQTARAQFSFFTLPGVLAPDGAPPRAIIYRPSRGSELGSLTLANYTLNSDLSSMTNGGINRKLKGAKALTIRFKLTHYSSGNVNQSPVGEAPLRRAAAKESGRPVLEIFAAAASTS